MVFLEVNNLRKQYQVQESFFSTRTKVVRAVNGVSFALEQGETLGLVGESGCGKTTTGRMVGGLIKCSGGTVFIEGKDIAALKKQQLLSMRKEVQIIFQDPFASLDPRMQVGVSIGEGIEIHGLASAQGRKQRVNELLKMVGLSDTDYGRYPHEFSGGQRQRVGIARALATEPKLLIADEPVSALDVSIQAQIVNLLEDLQKELHFAMLFIAHDIRVVAHLSRRIAVMYAGRIVELADSEELVKEPLHPYTKALFSAIPWPDPVLRARRHQLAGEPPSPFALPQGCPFHPRCPQVMEECKGVLPELKEVKLGHWVECYLY